MATPEILNLDEIVAADVPIKFAGQSWRMPGDPPSELLLRVIHLHEELGKAGSAAQAAAEAGTPDEDSTEVMLSMREQLAESYEALFEIRNAEQLEAIGGRLNLTDTQAAVLLNHLLDLYYGDEIPKPGEEGGERPTQPEPEGESTPPSSKNAKPSPARSPRRAPRKRASRSSASSRS